MKQNIILKTLTAAILSATALQVQAQGIYVNKKGGESVSYPKSVLDHVSPYMLKTSTSTTTLETGAVATLQYEKIADMKTARMGHQIFPSGNGFVVVGGHTTNFELTKTAELYENGQWKDISINNPHDGAFTVTLSDGRVMVGGGFSSKNGVGQSKVTDIYDPKTKSFTAGPDMTVARAYCKAVAVGNKVYVSGNWYADDKVMDCYDGSTFKAVGDMDGRSNPYLLYDKENNVYSVSAYGIKGADFGFYTYEDGSKALSGDVYVPLEDKTFYYRFKYFSQWVPLSLPTEARVEDNAYTYEGNNYFVVLTKNGDQYQLTEPCPDQNTTYIYSKFDIPSRHPVTNAVINYRGTVYSNEAKGEYYLIGSSGTVPNQTVHIISYNFVSGYWTIASASGFTYDLMSGSWTLLNDGRLACTGGGIDSNFNAQKYAYLFTPPTAGESNSGTSTTVDYGVDVYKKDGTYDRYLEKDLESITTFEEHFDDRITQEIPQEYLSKMSAYMPIYSGNTPPNIEGTYNLSPDLMVYNSNPNSSYKPGDLFYDCVTKYSNQNMTQNTATYQEENVYNGTVSSRSDPAEARILGKGNNFTAFTIVETTIESENSWTKMATIVSGTMTSEGIKDYYYGILMLDKRDPNNKRMKIGDFRIFKDGDGLSVPTTWLNRQRAAGIKDINPVPGCADEAPFSIKSKFFEMKKETK